MAGNTHKTSEGKISYSPLKTLLRNNIEQHLKDFGVLERKGKYSHIDILKQYIGMKVMTGQPVGGDMTDWVLFMEYQYLTSQRETIFPSSKEIIDMIVKSKFNVEQFDKIIPYADTFSIIMPDGYVSPSGVPIKSFMVQWQEENKVREEYRKICRLAGANTDFPPSENEGSMILNVMYIDKDNQAVRISGFNEDIKGMLSAVDKRENDVYAKAVGISSAKLDDLETKTLQVMVKIAVGMSVFGSAFSDFFEKGIPKNTKLKKVGEVNLNISSLVGVKLTDKIRVRRATSPSGHMRGHHFRQLMSERYYRNEHSDKPVGSRIIPVEGSWVGEAIDAVHTKDNHN